MRTALATDPTASCVVLLDDAGRPQWMIDRNRFLLAVTGPYGHALHARRTAKRLADEPRVVPIGASVFDLTIDLSDIAHHDCPPITHYRIVFRDRACKLVEQAFGQCPAKGVAFLLDAFYCG